MRRWMMLLLGVALVAGCATGPDPSVGTVAPPSEGASPVATLRTAAPAVSPALTPTAPAPSAAPAAPSGPPASPAPTASPTSTIAWTSRSIPAYTESGGGGLAFDGKGLRLHVVVAPLEGAVLRWVEGERVADDGSAYMWSRDLGRTWSRERIFEGYGPRVAAAGGSVYVAMMAYACGTAAAVTRNPRNGAARAWSLPVCLGRDGTSVEIAAAGRGVYAATMDDRGGLAVWTSRDRGRTYRRTTLVRRSDALDGDLVGVAADGRRVIVGAGGSKGGVWTSEDAGATWARAVGIPTGKPTAVAAAASLQAVAGLTMETNADGDPEPVAAWVAVRPADGPWTLLDPLPSSGTELQAIRAIGVGASGSVDVITAGWDEGCGEWARWTDGAGWTSPQPAPGCPDDPAIVEDRDGTPVVLTYDDDGDFDYAIAIGTVTPAR